jgi:PIN domain nuclease of toxin-antitoxin system
LILLDTHAFVWLADGSEQLSGRARRAIAEDLRSALGGVQPCSLVAAAHAAAPIDSSYGGA